MSLRVSPTILDDPKYLLLATNAQNPTAPRCLKESENFTSLDTPTRAFIFQQRGVPVEIHLLDAIQRMVQALPESVVVQELNTLEDMAKRIHLTYVRTMKIFNYNGKRQVHAENWHVFTGVLDGYPFPPSRTPLAARPDQFLVITQDLTNSSSVHVHFELEQFLNDLEKNGSSVELVGYFDRNLYKRRQAES